MEEPVRLSKRMSELGLASRREADTYIERGLVLVNGQRATLGQKVTTKDVITLDTKIHLAQNEQISVVLNKPIGYVSGQAEDGYEPAKVLIRNENHWGKDENTRSLNPKMLAHLVPAGRLDIDSTGLLILTQNGRLVKKIIGEDAKTDKEYIVRVAQIVTGALGADAAQIAKLRFGLSLDGKALQRARVEAINEAELRFTLIEGKKRQIRRMCEAVGLKVLRLKRVRVGPVVLGPLPLGTWRYLTDIEARKLLDL